MIKETLSEVYNLLRQAAEKIFPEVVTAPVEDSTSISSLYEQVFYKSMESEEWVWLIDLYVDESKDMFAIFSKDGLLYKALIEVENSKVSIGELIRVEEVFEPVKESRMIIQRQKDNSVRWFLVASSNVLNRNGAIDSSKLFDNLVKDAYKNDRFPYLTFWHQGENLKMGMTDWVAREENLLLASGTFDDGIVAKAMIRAYEEDPNYWGSSISFWPTEGHMEQVAEDIKVPMYTDGYFEEISILPEEQACCLFTALKSKGKVNRMKPELIEGIKKLAGDDEVAEELIGMVDEVNREINDKGLIRRESEESNSEQPKDEQTEIPETEVPEEEETPSTEPVQESSEPASLEIDDDLVNEIVNRLAEHPKMADSIDELRNLVAQQKVSLENMALEVAGLRSSLIKENKVLVERVVKLEADDEQKRDEWVKDLPRKKQTIAIHRARVQTEGETEEESFEDLASRTIEVLK